MKKTLPFLAAAFACLAASASAQSLENVSVETGVSTLGFYIGPKVEVSPQWDLRAPIYLGSLSDTFDVEGSDIDGKLESNSVSIMADYKLGNSGFRLSGGVSAGGYELDGSTNTLTLDGTTYDANFTAELKQKRNVAPVLAVGYARELGGNWGFVAEIGARITSLELTTTGQDAIIIPALRDQFDTDLAQVNRDLSDIKAIPFVTFGVSYNF